MTPAEATLLAQHAASVWPDVIVSVWEARLVSAEFDFAETRAALGRLRVGGARDVSIQVLAAEILAGRQPCRRCGGTGFLTEERPSAVLFEHDAIDQAVTVIDEPALDPTADGIEVARAWAAAIRRGREHGQVVTRARVVHITNRCPDCTATIKGDTR